MKIRANFDERVVVHSETLDWIQSPMAGVDRRPLDRVGEELARATSIVRYAPNSRFSPHIHSGGEEFIVLSGIFQDEHGDYPAGTYIRNPPTSRHTPRSDEGCIIFVKLWQFQLDDRKHVSIELNINLDSINSQEITEQALYEDNFETVQLIHVPPNHSLSKENQGGYELFVLSGEIVEQGDKLVKHSWLRLPQGTKLSAHTGKSGAIIWMKSGHLIDVDNQIRRVMIANDR